MSTIEERVNAKALVNNDFSGSVIYIDDAIRIAKEYAEEMKDKLIKSLTVFTEKPIGTIEGDLCDWNSPSVFTHNYSPEELQKAVVKRINETFQLLATDKDGDK
ncbi:MAG: hypothetical protein WC974_09335 [Thermoplasmata archaeon]